VRGLALAALARGEKRANVARMLGVPLGTLDRWRREFRRSGKQAAAPRGHKRAAFSAEDLPRLAAQLRAASDATQEQHAATWRASTGQAASRGSVQRAMRVLGWTHKKRA
jgi:transposase